MKFNKYLTVLKEKLYNSIGFPFSDVINDDIIQQALKDEQMEYRQRLYTPMIILWAWIYQCLSEKNTCKKDVVFLWSTPMVNSSPVLLKDWCCFRSHNWFSST